MITHSQKLLNYPQITTMSPHFYSCSLHLVFYLSNGAHYNNYHCVIDCIVHRVRPGDIDVMAAFGDSISVYIHD